MSLAPERRRALAAGGLVVLGVAAALIVLEYRARATTVARLAGDDVAVLAARQAVACPEPHRARVYSILVFGQSNAGNHGRESPGRQAADERVIEFHRGRCHVANSPMLGATGTGASFLPRLGLRLADAGFADRVVIGVYAIDGARIDRFIRRGSLARQIREAMTTFVAEFRPDAVLWIQGEADFAQRTSAAAYRDGLAQVRADMTAAGIAAPLYVAVQSRCADPARWHADNPVAMAQSEAPSSIPGVKAGINTDRDFVGPQLRFDGCHFGPQGMERVADAWADVLMAGRPANPQPPQRHVPDRH